MLHVASKREVLEQVRKMDPFRFEQLVIDLLVAMGYGGSREEAAQVTKASGDEGIDGVTSFMPSFSELGQDAAAKSRCWNKVIRLRKPLVNQTLSSKASRRALSFFHVLGVTRSSMRRISSLAGFGAPSPSILGMARRIACRKSSRPGRK